MEIRVSAIDLHCFVPNHRGRTAGWPPMKFHELRFAFCIDHAVGVHAEAFHHPQGTWNCPVGHDPSDHVHALGAERDEIPKGVVRGARLGKTAVRFHFHGMHQVGKFDRVLNEENRNVVSHQVEVAFLGIEFNGKPAHISRHIARTRAARHRGKPRKHFRLHFRVLEEGRLG